MSDYESEIEEIYAALVPEDDAENGRITPYPVSQEIITTLADYQQVRAEVAQLRHDLEMHAEALAGANLVIRTLQERNDRWGHALADLAGAAIACGVLDREGTVVEDGTLDYTAVLRQVTQWLYSFAAQAGAERGRERGVKMRTKGRGRTL